MDSLDGSFCCRNMKPQLCSKHNQPIINYNHMNQPSCQICIIEKSGMTTVEEIQNKLKLTLKIAKMELDEQRQYFQTLLDSLNNHKKDLLSELEKIMKNIQNQIIYMNQQEEKFKLICLSKINQLQCIEEIQGQQQISQKNYIQFSSLIIQKLQEFQLKFINIDHLLKQINENTNIMDKVKDEKENQKNQQISLDSKGHYEKGNSLYDLGKYQDAIQCYDEAIKLLPNQPEVYYNKGCALRKSCKYQDAIQCFDQAIKLKPNYPEAYYNKGNSLRKLGKYQDAIQCYNKSIKLNPQYTKAIDNRNSAILELQKQQKKQPGYQR